MTLDIRGYDPARDFDAVHRIWREVGWIDDSDGNKAALRRFGQMGDAEVGLIDGEAECFVHRTPGTIHYEDTALPLCAITAVTTSHVGRKQGFASTMTARALRSGAEAGAAVGALGMFEQGFYDRFGFGTGSYDHQLTFDPSSLRVAHVPYRTPVRVTPEDAADVQAAMAGRMKHHGAVVLDPVDLVAAELGWAENGYGLGYRDRDGRLTHFFAGELKGEHGPFRINAIAYQTTGQLMELLRLLREPSDQIHSVTMVEPAEVQLQVLIDNPMRERHRSLKSELESGNRGIAWWQLRVLDLHACVAATEWSGAPVEFTLELSDPLAERFVEGWRGIGGSYTVRVGTDAGVTNGATPGVPSLRCDVSAFTRLWFGVAPASSLAVTDRFDAPQELCGALDRALRLPPVIPGWMF